MNLGANALYVCDALSLLERLPSGTVALTYLDPPWHSNRDFLFSETPLQAQVTEQHATYLSKVVQQVRRVLTHDGNLLVHWSLTSPLDVRLVMNQSFGEQPRYEITWHTKRPRVRTNKGPTIDNEFLLVYSKSPSPVSNPIRRPLSPEEASKFSHKDENGRLYYPTPLTLPVEGRRFRWRGYEPPAGQSWRFSVDRLEALASDNRIYFPFPSNRGMPRLKQYLDKDASVEIGTTWEDIPSFISARERVMVGQRPLALLQRIIQLASNTGDTVLDPFFGSGTTLVAAHMLGRRWWGADSDPNAHEVTQERLLAVCGLQVHKDYVLYEMADLWDVQAMETDYQGVVTNIEQIIQLQRDIDELTNHLISFKMLLDIRDDDEGLTEDTIEQMEQEITALLNQRRSVESYIPVVCAWLVDWDQLDGASRVFLPQAEMAFEMLSRNRSQDYSMFILQYCRALENELLTKLFVAYTGDLYARFTNVSAFLSKETGETKSFAASLKNRKEGYTLGEMVRILDLLQTDDQLVVRSDLLEDFRSFTLRYFDEHVIDKAYLDRIKEINRDYRRKSAHPYLLDAQAAERCRELLRECLNQLILSYKGSAAAPVPNED